MDDSQVGLILRKARNRRKVDLSEVEAATRIRARFLRAIENEEWDVLPGGVYTRGFIRTYAAFLGLDGERLAADYRASVENPAAARSAASEPIRVAPPDRAPRKLPRAGLLAFTGVILVAVIAIAVIPGGDSGGGGGQQSRHGAPASEPVTEKPKQRPTARTGVAVRLAASAEVWVCVLDARGQRLVDGKILEAGAEEGPFHSGSFTVSFGNGEVSMLIDGKEAEIPATSSPIGYSIDAAGALTELSEAERPTCT
jgi:hypothetical protein